VKALARTADEYDYDARLMNAVEAVNDDQKHVLFDKVSHYFRGDLSGKTVALWGCPSSPRPMTCARHQAAC